MNSGLFLAAYDLYQRYRWFKKRDDLTVLMSQSIAEAHDGPEYLLWLINWFGSMPACTHVDQIVCPPHSSHANMPSLQRIFAYWHAEPEQAQDLFGHHVGAMMRKHRFCCFGCTGRSRLDPDTGLSPGDYERAHLQDACLGGPNTPSNLVPLCNRCHSRMTDHFSGCRTCAAAWIKWINGGTCACHGGQEEAP